MKQHPKQKKNIFFTGNKKKVQATSVGSSLPPLEVRVYILSLSDDSLT